MRALVQHILSLVSHPILNFLYRWIYDGELEDTYHEVKRAGFNLVCTQINKRAILFRNDFVIWFI